MFHHQLLLPFAQVSFYVFWSSFLKLSESTGFYHICLSLPAAWSSSLQVGELPRARRFALKPASVLQSPTSQSCQSSQGARSVCWSQARAVAKKSRVGKVPARILEERWALSGVLRVSEENICSPSGLKCHEESLGPLGTGLGLQ